MLALVSAKLHHDPTELWHLVPQSSARPALVAAVAEAAEVARRVQLPLAAFLLLQVGCEERLLETQEVDETRVVK